MISKDKIIHDLALLFVEKTFEFNGALNTPDQLAVEYDIAFQAIRDQLADSELCIQE